MRARVRLSAVKSTCFLAAAAVRAAYKGDDANVVVVYRSRLVDTF